jgi:hyperosmotically inducible periplasmic protein
MKTTALRPAALFVAAAAALTLAACDDNRTVGQQVDSGVASAERKTEQVASNAREATANAAATVSEKAGDAAITTAINAEYAKDDRLSAIKIDVDTNDGRVTLTGSAPDAASKDRATMLANNVKGVKAVDNKLDVKP